eukprot:SAG31_NODE_7945_length_1557_cov_2.327846_1_plen_343_part_00
METPVTGYLPTTAARSGAILSRMDCEAALVVAVSLPLQPFSSVALHDAGILSPTGECRPFDQSGDGLVIGEGCAAIILQRCETSMSDSSWYALVHGHAVTENVITSSLDLNAPDVKAEEEAIRSTLTDAGVTKQQVALVHAHGIGQQVADGAEVMAYCSALLDPSRPLVLANHKGNFGHTTAVAGLLGAITTTLVLSNRLVPTQIGLETPIKALQSSKNGSFSIPNGAPLYLPADDEMFAGLHGHAISGTNVHIILSSHADCRSCVDASMNAQSTSQKLQICGGNEISPVPLQQTVQQSVQRATPDAVTKVLVNALADVGINVPSLDLSANLCTFYGVSCKR